MCSKKQVNKVLENHGDWLLIDISTPKHPDSTMAVDTDVFNSHEGGRIFAMQPSRGKYIEARYNNRCKNKHFHHDVISLKDGLEVDHITHGSMQFVDNRLSNLRLVTSYQNKNNRSLRSDNTSGVSGVCWSKKNKKWIAKIKLNGINKHLGSFDSIGSAICARQRAERDHYGEYAYSANN